ncbi:formylglycine-generating enzyme family protein [Desulfurivibrio dismutans]|uniref:formylglycine-generating enzyme family protein n=1 Tax=Desulfurivibrio dismutans TaxID=1398908 RepID=UPI0023D9FD33|nr:formylglycine-generating enzyme family protein [Desulfurivibrio alkaliphilus]MDF1614394.1 formylglycine-generating enzyme family protein [Desulfurivibrio alkaliphilus]
MFCGEALPEQELTGATDTGLWVDPKTGTELVLVPAGSFRMGNIWDDGGRDEQPVHLVQVAAFQLARYPVTQAQWQAVMGDNPAAVSGEIFVGDHKPVVNVSWNDAQEFIARLNRAGGENYRLPSEAEWEYAARAGGKEHKWAGGSDEKTLTEYAWFSANSQGRPQPVGRKLPNGLGLHDMSGNVWEWCEDVWHPNYEGAPADSSPRLSVEPGDREARRRVMRGGSWNFNALNARTTYRDWNDIDYRFFVIGLRLAR